MEFPAAKLSRYDFGRMISKTHTLEQTGTALQGMAALTEVKPVIDPYGVPAEAA